MNKNHSRWHLSYTPITNATYKTNQRSAPTPAGRPQQSPCRLVYRHDSACKYVHTYVYTYICNTNVCMWYSGLFPVALSRRRRLLEWVTCRAQVHAAVCIPRGETQHATHPPPFRQRTHAKATPVYHPLPPRVERRAQTAVPQPPLPPSRRQTLFLDKECGRESGWVGGRVVWDAL